MLNHEGSHPEYFEELCALAATGQISEPEFVELQDHLQECAHCRSIYGDFMDLLHNKLPLADPELLGSPKLPVFFLRNSSYRQRFIARARKEGLAISYGSSRGTLRDKSRIELWPGLGYVQVATVAIAVLLVTVGILGYRLHESNARNRALTADMAAMGTRSSQPGSSASDLPKETSTTAAPLDTARTQPAVGPSVIGTEAELAKLEQDRAAAEAQSKALEEQLQKVASELQALRAQNEETSDSRNQLDQKLKEAEQVANAVKNDLQEIHQARSRDSLTIAAQDLEIQKLSEKLTAQAEMLEQETALLEASRDVRDLMGARSFHIADVYDVDSKGKDQRAFGRIFYTEGKSTLIFYAFDLSDRNAAKRNASFQVWGKRGPAQNPAHSLGIFQIDDQKQNRWVLRFEDTRILAEIDSVFVTVEPRGGSARPTGRQFLFAYLNANPNHR
jgi:anti-sigma-K factor RskA